MNLKEFKKQHRKNIGFIIYYWIKFLLLFDIPWQIEKYKDRKELKEITNQELNK